MGNKKEFIRLNEMDQGQRQKLSQTDINEIAAYNNAVAQEKLERYLSYPGHKMPVTRREFLAAGIGGFAASMSLPTVFEMLLGPNFAFGEDLQCPKGDMASQLPGIITINPAGGQGIQGIVVPLDKGLQKLPSYSQHSMGTNPNTVQRFGALWNLDNPASSTFINQLDTAGINDNQCKVIAICCRTRSDSTENRNGIEGMAEKAKFVGSLLPLLGRQNTPTGGHYLNAGVDPGARLVVRSYETIRNSLILQVGNMSQKQKEALLKTINRFNERQIATVASANGAKKLNSLLQCAGIRNIDVNAKGSEGINPVNDRGVADIWGLSAQTNPASQNYVLSAMAYNTLLGQAGTSTFTLGDYDYHGVPLESSQGKIGTRERDVRVMDLVAKSVRTAAALGRSAVILLRTDGSCSSANSTTPADWQGDRDDGMHLMVLYNPDLAGVNLLKSQIGAFTNDQDVDKSVGPYDNNDLLAKIIMANILKFAGKTSEIPAITGLQATDPNIVVG